MIFSGDLADKVLAGAKTQTRRPVKGASCQYRVGCDYAIQHKRGTPGLGPRIRILRVDSVPTFPISEDDALAEGFASPSAFESRWFELYGNRRPGRVWRIEFELVDVFETIEQRATRILDEGRLTVEKVDPDTGLIVASCRGFSGEVYRLGFDPRPRFREYRCGCEANAKFRRRCSHLIALQRVTVKPKPS